MEIIYTLGDTVLTYAETIAEIITAEMPSILCNLLGVPTGTAWIFIFVSPTILMLFLAFVVFRWATAIL